MKGFIECIDCDARVERTGNCQKRCPECRVTADHRRQCEAVKRWRESNRERARQSAREYYRRRGPVPVTDREAARAAAARWKTENPAGVARAAKKRRAKMALVNANATRRYEPYTHAEDSVISEWPESLYELAAALGRTVEAVTQRRLTLRKGCAPCVDPLRHCGICGIAFAPNSHTQKFCGRRCSLAAKVVRQRRYDLRKRGVIA